MKLKYELLKDTNTEILSEKYLACYNAKGLYDSMQFVVRLRPDIHAKIQSIEPGIVKSGDYDFDTFQAFSTYFHETIHWWQHIGSISGFILSLSYPSQAHINRNRLLEYVNKVGLIKPIKKYNELHGNDENVDNEKFQTINYILNNFHDIEFFKFFVLKPSSANSVVQNKLFESVGHSYYIAYSAFLDLLASTIDHELNILPNYRAWGDAFRKLDEDRVEGYYYGSSVGIPPIGLIELFEGQARFSQIQYLYFGSGKKLTWDDFESLGMLSDVYYSAFALFLELTDSERPEQIDDSLVALFLLVLDLSMNPTDGFPFAIEHFESFVVSVDPGIRFILFCNAIKEELSHLKTCIKEYSFDEYVSTADTLCKSMYCKSPIAAGKIFKKWAEDHDEIKEPLNKSPILA